MKKCEYCKDFNAEKHPIEITDISIGGLFYNYECLIKFCPNCGNELNRYKSDNSKYKPEFENIRYGDK